MSATHILVVEDDADIRSALCSLLASEGYDVAGARDGREALAALHEGPSPDVILLDLMMPIMNGAEFRAAQRQDPAIASIPIIVITASIGPRQVTSGLDAAAVLPKPFELSELVEIIDLVVARARVARPVPSPAPVSPSATA